MRVGDCAKIYFSADAQWFEKNDIKLEDRSSLA